MVSLSQDQPPPMAHIPRPPQNDHMTNNLTTETTTDSTMSGSSFTVDPSTNPKVTTDLIDFGQVDPSLPNLSAFMKPKDQEQIQDQDPDIPALSVLNLGQVTPKAVTEEGIPDLSMLQQPSDRLSAVEDALSKVTDLNPFAK